MFNRIFYHSLTRKYVTLFGNLFNDIIVRRFDNEKQTIQVLKVPIAYGPKEKWVALLNMPLRDRPIAVQLPRLSFQINSINYDPDRQLIPTHKNSSILLSDTNTLLTEFVPVPYKIGMDLFVIVKNADDGAQIYEQIAPYFVPDLVQQITLIPEMDLKYDIKIEMTGGFSIEDAYEATFQERRVMIFTIPFEMTVFFFGPISTQGVIKRVQVDLIPVPGQGPVTQEETQRHGRQSRIVVTPGLTEDGQPTSDPELTIPFQQIEAEDDYGFVEEFFFFQDGRKYNPVTGEDE